jgi:hypothetical protein
VAEVEPDELDPGVALDDLARQIAVRTAELE